MLCPKCNTNSLVKDEVVDPTNLSTLVTTRCVNCNYEEKEVYPGGTLNQSNGNTYWSTATSGSYQFNKHVNNISNNDVIDMIIKQVDYEVTNRMDNVRQHVDEEISKIDDNIAKRVDSKLNSSKFAKLQEKLLDLVSCIDEILEGEEDDSKRD